MKKLLFTVVLGFSIFSMNAQNLKPTSHIWTSGTADDFRGGYTLRMPHQELHGMDRLLAMADL